MHIEDFNYDLPSELIARYPLKERTSSRLMCLSGESVATHQFANLTSLLKPNDLLICNDTRVIPARLIGKKLTTAGRVEILIERILDKNRILVQLKASKSPKPGTRLVFENVQFEVICRHEDLYELRCLKDQPVLEVIEAIGQIPLPPYMTRPPEASDHERYQTVYAAYKGSVAAPTAGLHFDLALLNQLKVKGVQIAYLTLHVGAGTFAPVRVENIAQHRMHPEYTEVTPQLCQQIQQTKAQGGRVIAVGTTTARSLETACLSGSLQAYQGDTDIFIYPGFQFQCIDGLITNFHLPRSTLMMLVTAFGGHTRVMQAYRTAVQEKYRFFSYGDAMFIQDRFAHKE